MSIRFQSVLTIAAIVAACTAFTGCASVVNDVTHPVRFETVTTTGAAVKDASCAIDNDYGHQEFRTPATVNVRRSSKDLQISCTQAGQPDGQGTAISRANGGMAGNILLGGGVGAIIDHNRGTAYTYPEWIQIVMGRTLTYDRKADVDGKPNVGAVPAAAAGAAAATSASK